MLHPRLRPVEVIPVEQDGKQSFALRDPSGMASGTIVISPAVAYILQRFDGAHSLEQIQREMVEAVGERVPLARLTSLVESLEQAHFLEGPAFEAHERRVIVDYRAAEFRKPALAGQGYPSGRQELLRWHAELEAGSGEGEGDAQCAAKAETPRQVLGFAAPHIDLRFGAESCKLAHNLHSQRSGPVDTVVVLGTGHSLNQELFTLTRQSYGTPLGVVETDLELVEGLVGRLGEEHLLGEEIQHLAEHSVEFQSLFLRVHAEQDPQPPPKMLPVLVGSFLPLIEQNREPFQDERVRGFVEALQAEVLNLGRRVTYLASIDLAHKGPRYGDADGLTEEQARALERDDRELLSFAEAGDPEGFFRHNQAVLDERRVCGFSALYTLLRLLPGAKGRLLRYTQTTFPDTIDTVSHCALLFERNGTD